MLAIQTATLLQPAELAIPPELPPELELAVDADDVPPLLLLVEKMLLLSLLNAV